jgi:hypothetical protein
MIAFTGFNSDRRVRFAVLFICTNDVLVYVNSFFHFRWFLFVVGLQTLRIKPAMVKRFYFRALFF